MPYHWKWPTTAQHLVQPPHHCLPQNWIPQVDYSTFSSNQHLYVLPPTNSVINSQRHLCNQGPTLSQSTSPLNRDPLFEKGNLICHMGASPNLRSTYLLLPSRTLCSSIPCSANSPKPSGIPNHVVWATNSRYTKPCTRILAPGALDVSNHVSPQSANQLQHHYAKGHNDTSYGYGYTPSLLAIFFPSATTPAALHYPEFTNKYSPQYSRWSFLLYFMTNILFSTFLSPLPSPLSTIQPIHNTFQPPSLPTTPLPSSSHLPYFPFLYLKPVTEHYPLESTNILYSLVDNHS